MAESPDRGRAPELGPAPRARLPAVHRERLPGGVELVTLPGEAARVAVLEAVVRAGSARDAPESAGRADLTAHLLPEGAAGLGMLELAERLDALGGALEVGVDHDAARIRLTTLARHAGDGVELLADLLVRPEFPDSEVARVLVERQVDLRRDLDQPAIVAARAFSAELYGLDHPYGHPSDGTPATVETLGRDAFVGFYRATYAPGSTTLVAVGAIDPAAIGNAAARAFEGWEGDAAAEPDVSPPPEPGRGVVLVDRPGSPQSELRVGHVGVARDHPDHVALAALDHLLGGSFHSRINLNLRERRGWTYGARSRFVFRRGPGPFVVATPVAADVTVPALREIVGEIERAAEGPIEAAERDLAVNGLTRSLPRLFETPTNVADRVREIVVHDLPDDYWSGYQGRFRALSVDDLEQAAATHLDPGRLLMIVVGDAGRVRNDVEPLGEVRERRWKPAGNTLRGIPAAG